MRAQISINTDNDAFSGGMASEIGRILRKLAKRIEETGDDYVPLMDINGNKVGEFNLTKDDAPAQAKPVRIVAEIRGGCLVGLYCSDAQAEFTLLDRDNLQNEESDDPETDAKSLRVLEQEISTLTDIS